MVFYTIFMGIIELSAFMTQIGHDLRNIRGPLQGTVCLLEGI